MDGGIKMIQNHLLKTLWLITIWRELEPLDSINRQKNTSTSSSFNSFSFLFSKIEPPPESFTEVEKEFEEEEDEFAENEKDEEKVTVYVEDGLIESILLSSNPTISILPNSEPWCTKIGKLENLEIGNKTDKLENKKHWKQKLNWKYTNAKAKRRIKINKICKSVNIEIK